MKQKLCYIQSRSNLFLLFALIGISIIAEIVLSQPNKITDLTVISGLNYLSEGSLKLVWTYPGPETLPEGSAYYVQYSTFSEVNWSTTAAQIVISTGSVYDDEVQVYVVTGLDKVLVDNHLSKNTTFYFAIRISSGNEVLSELSNIATGWITTWQPYAEFSLATQGEKEGEIYLQFKGCDDFVNNNMSNPLTGYWYIQYSTDEFFTSWSLGNAQKVISTHTFNSHQIPAAVTITGLSSGVTYYFRLWAKDDLGIYSEISNGATCWSQVDVSPPRPVTYIKPTVGFKHINLEWLVPYEDSYSDGFLYNNSSFTAYFEIRYSSTNINSESLWNSATSFGVFGPYVLLPLSSTRTVITGLTNFTTYYFAIKVADEKLNWSGIGEFNIGGTVYKSSSPFSKPVNSPPQANNPSNHYAYDPVRNTTSTVISSTTVILKWDTAGWHPGRSNSDNSFDIDYGDDISSYTVRIATYIISGQIMVATITVYGLTTTSCSLHSLREDVTYYWQLSVYDKESISSTTAVFFFVINSTNSAPVFPSQPLISPTTGVWHTKEFKITFSWKAAYDPDPYDSVHGYAIFISSNNQEWYRIPKSTSEYFSTTSTKIITTEQYCWSLFEDAENKRIYWYVTAFDNGERFGHTKLSSSTAVGTFWLNQFDSPPAQFEVYFPSGTPTVLSDGNTYYKVIIAGTTYYPIMMKIFGSTTYYIAKSTPIILSWQPTYDPDPEDGIIEYSVFVTSWPTPENAPNAWIYVNNPIQDYAPYPSNYWPSYWNFFTSTAIVNTVQPGTQEGYNLVLIENLTYYWRARARDSAQNLNWIWDSTQTFAPPVNVAPVRFIVDFVLDPPSLFDVVTPTGVVNPNSLEQLYFDWTDAYDPDPFDSIKHYFISVSTVCPATMDEWFTLPAPLWKINVWIQDPKISSTTLNFLNPKLQPGGTYYWQIHSWGKNEWGYSVNPSTAQPYLVKPYGIALTTGCFVISNQKPNKFNLIYPGSSTLNTPVAPGVKTYRPKFEWEQGGDPDNYDPIISSYVVRLSSFYNFSVYEALFSTTTSVQLSFDLNPRTTYYWNVIAYDNFGNYEFSNTTFYFYVVNFEPNNFELVYPTANVVVNTLVPEFKFINRGDPDSDIVYYKIEYSSFSDFSIYVSSERWNNRDVSIGSTITIPSPWNFEENKKYYWRVVAYDEFGGVTTSTVQSFWVNAQEEPPQSFDLSVSTIQGILSVQQVKFEWNYTTDPDPGDIILKYRIVISTVGNYVVGVSTYVEVSSNTLRYDFFLSTLIEDAAYCWWVEAYDNTGRYTKSISSYVFIVDLSTKEPDGFSLIWPGKENEFFRLSSSPVTFVWQAANRAEWWKSINYTFYLSSSPQNYFVINFSSGPYNYWYQADKVYFSTYSLQENTTYFWWVKAENSIGVSWSTTFYFFYDQVNQPPANFYLISPSGTVNTRLPDFKWTTATDFDDKVIRYIIAYSTFSNFSSSITVIVSHPNNSFTPQIKLLRNTTYYWRVIAEDERGGQTSSSIDFQFYVPDLKPLPVSNISPSGNISTRRPTISWLPSGHTDYKGTVNNYKLSLRDSLNNIVVSQLIPSTTTQYVVTQNLLQNITYYITVTAVDDDNVESIPHTVSFFVLPVNIPKKVLINNFIFEKQGPQLFFISMDWYKVNTYIDGTLADDIAGYNIYRSTSFDSLYTEVYYRVQPATVTSFTEYISGENTKHVYYYGVKTVTIGGVESEQPDEVLSTFVDGSRMLVFQDAKLIIPLSVYSEIKSKGYTIEVSSYDVGDIETKYLGIVKKYVIGLHQVSHIKGYKFSKPIILEVNKEKIFQAVSLKFANVNYNNNIASLKPAVFFYNNVEYLYVHTEQDIGSIRSKITQPGLYAVRFVSLPSSAEVVNIVPKKIFTPASSKDDKIQFILYNPTATQPEGEIYDIDLRYVAKLKYDGINVLSWDGRYEDGTVVLKGVYIYRIKIGDKIFTGTVIVAK
ncbi:MAG: fibronectin type III domain-containing protein [Endomicrobia bacterium]|nr:fibronectin type III domain-containing protein [Endomicrobiia bacterium]